MINIGTAAPRVGDATDKKGHGRWRLNSGSEMMMHVGALSEDAIRTVVDFSSAKCASDRIVALFDHDHDRIIGYWERFNISSQGIEADLHLIIPEGDAESRVFADALRVAVIARSGVPIEVSISAEPDDDANGWELVPAGEKITLNGREYSGDGESALYVLKGARIYEASIVTFGADSVTGRIAASLKSPVKKEEDRMSDKLKALLGKYTEKHHGLVARRFVAGIDEAVIHNEIHAAEMDEKDHKIKAMEDEISALKAECAKLHAAGIEKGAQTEAVEHNSAPGVINEQKNILPETSAGRSMAAAKISNEVAIAARGSKTAVGFTATEDSKDYPKTLSAAMDYEVRSGNKLTGFALRKSIVSAHPDIERK